MKNKIVMGAAVASIVTVIFMLKNNKKGRVRL